MIGFLIRKQNGWELLEAKSSGKKKAEHIADIAIQSFVTRNSGVELVNVKLILINPDFIYAGNEDYKNLVNDQEDVTDLIVLEEKNIIDQINKLKTIQLRLHNKVSEIKGRFVYLSYCNLLDGYRII